MLTISQLASYAGVTVRAVRHYHAKGLLPEPERDHSGYRRYDASAVVELVRIRTLADAGVPLSRVKELLGADETEFAAAVAEIDQRLRAEIREQQRHRERMIEGERDAWILVAAQQPESMPTYMALKLAQLEDPSLVDLHRDLGAAALDWTSDDPRLPALADRLVATIEAIDDAEWEASAEHEMSDEFVELLDSIFLDSAPIAARLLALLEERGWRGWTKLERICSSALSHPHRESHRAGPAGTLERGVLRLTRRMHAGD